jgi:hypothetical protein
MAIPHCFCWTRFGTEAGQDIKDILERKEQERLLNGGMFLWGIGNGIGPSMVELTRRTPVPEALFSPIKSAPRQEDRAPKALAAWSTAESLYGRTFVLPEQSLVTSKYDPQLPKRSHYALVCYSEVSLKFVQCSDKISASSLVNLLTARPVGASQVTAVVKHSPLRFQKGLLYDISFRVSLMYPFFLKLTNPIVLSETKLSGDLSALVRSVWKEKMHGSLMSEPQDLLSACTPQLDSPAPM